MFEHDYKRRKWLKIDTKILRITNHATNDVKIGRKGVLSDENI
ncbi:hypothetical protein J14TS5_53460 [Paenibacillus lautus]|nr:hypothetical protein J14TS5_53460 [Paenibacillus lautus]